MTTRSPLSARERDQIVDELKDFMRRWRIMPATVMRFARIAAREAGI